MNVKFHNLRSTVLDNHKPKSSPAKNGVVNVASDSSANGVQSSADHSVESSEVTQSFIIKPSRGLVLQLVLMAMGSIALALILIRFASFLESVGNWGYVGVALVEFGNSAMLAIPTPSYAYTFAMGSILNPFVIGVIGGTFAMLGELIGYYLGRNGSVILPRSPRVERFKTWTGKWGAVVLFFFALLPVPFDIAGIWAGAAHYPLIRFIPIVALGKTIKITGIAIAGYYGMDILTNLAIGFGI